MDLVEVQENSLRDSALKVFFYWSSRLFQEVLTKGINMSIKGNNVNSVLHRIRIKLYPNYLPAVDGKYIARTDNEASLSIQQVCAAMKERGGFTGNYGDLMENVNKFLDESAYQLCDGFAVNMGYFSIHPNIGGTFNSMNETYDQKKNPINFKFRALAPLRNLIKHIAVDIGSVVDRVAYIDEFTDKDEDSVNGIFVPGNIFSIIGNKIKIAGDHPDCGIFFVPVDNPEKAVKVTRIAENNPTKLIGIVPETEYIKNRIEIRTQYAGSGSTFLKVPRIISSSFIIEAS